MNNPNPKPFNERPFEERVAFDAGQLCLAIGEGSFQKKLASILMGWSEEAYNRGLAAGKDIAWREFKENAERERLKKQFEENNKLPEGFGI